MDSDMQIAVSQEQGRVPVTVFHLTGEITSQNYELLQTQADEAFETGTRHLLLDFTEVTYMSSAGLRAVHAIFKKLQEAGGEATPAEGAPTSISPHLKLLNTPPTIRKVIKAVGFDKFLEQHTNLEDAVASF